MNRRRLSWILVLVVACGALVVGATGNRPPATAAERVLDIAEDYKCPQCRGESVADSSATTARAIRLEIARQLEAGASEADVRAYLLSRYGDDLLLTPPSSGAASLVWVLPVAALVCAAAGLVVAFRRWRPREGVAA